MSYIDQYEQYQQALAYAQSKVSYPYPKADLTDEQNHDRVLRYGEQLGFYMVEFFKLSRKEPAQEQERRPAKEYRNWND